LSDLNIPEPTNTPSHPCIIIIAASAGSAVGEHGASHTHAEIDPIGDRVAEPATIYRQALRIDDPAAALGVLNPKV
jgi:hypothetical protein